MSEFFFTNFSIRVWKVPIQGKRDIGDVSVYGEVERFDWFGTARDGIEGFIQLRQRREFNHDVEFAESRCAKAEFSTRNSEACSFTPVTQR